MLTDTVCASSRDGCILAARKAFPCWSKAEVTRDAQHPCDRSDCGRTERPGGIAARCDHGEAVPRRNGDEGGVADLLRHTTFGAGPTPSDAPKAADFPHCTDTDSELHTLDYPLTLNVPCTLRPAKCAAPRRAGSRVAPEGSCLSAAASPGSSKVGPSHLDDGASLT